MVKQFVFVSVISLNHAAKVRRFLERRKRFSNNCVRTQRVFDSYQQNGQNQHFFGFSTKKRARFREIAYICNRMERRALTYIMVAALLMAGSMTAQTRQPVERHASGKHLAKKAPIIAEADGFTLRRAHDSLYWLNDWRLPYPVYQFQTGDVDGDGSTDAMVGVVKATRFYPEKGRRLFIFKLVNGKPRALWLGSKLGGKLVDFRFINGKLRALEQGSDGRYAVSDYTWSGFGMAHERFIQKGTDKQTAIKTFSQ